MRGALNNALQLPLYLQCSFVSTLFQGLQAPVLADALHYALSVSDVRGSDISSGQIIQIGQCPSVKVGVLGADLARRQIFEKQPGTALPQMVGIGLIQRDRPIGPENPIEVIVMPQGPEEGLFRQDR